MVFNKLPKEMRRTLALTLAASMVATGTQTPVLADQVQEVSVQEVQNAQTEAGEEQNVQAAEQQEEVPVAEQQTGTVGQAEAEESVEAQALSANEINVADPVTTDPEEQENELELPTVDEEEVDAETATESSATNIDMEVIDQNGNVKAVSCGFRFSSSGGENMARLVAIVPTSNEEKKPGTSDTVTLNVDTITVTEEDAQGKDVAPGTYKINTIYNDGSSGVCGSGLPKIELVVGPNVTEIGKNAFLNSPVVSLRFDDKSNLREIGESAFSSGNLSGEITIPKSVQTIGQSAFSKSKCTKVSFEDNSALTTIGEGVFASCTELTEVAAYPSSITYIPKNTFTSDAKLTRVDFADDNKLETIGESAFSGCGALISDERYTPIKSEVSTIGTAAFKGCNGAGFKEIAIPKKVTTLEDSTFEGCTKLETVAFTKVEGKDSVTKIGANCFKGNAALTECALPSHLVQVGTSAYSNTSITSVHIPKTLTTADAPFAGCEKITSITWDEGTKKVVDTLFKNLSCPAEEGAEPILVELIDSITEVGTSAFENSKISSVKGAGVVTVGNSAFSNNTKLEKIELNNCQTVGSYAFYNCKKLAKIELNACQEVGISAFQNCTDVTGKLKMPSLVKIHQSAFSKVGVSEFVISENLELLDESSFAQCTNLYSINSTNDNVDLSRMPKLKEIGKSAFSGCERIVGLQLGSAIEKVGEQAFAGLTALTELKFTESDSDTAGSMMIGTAAFSDCTNLVKVTIPKYIGEIGNSAFSGCIKLMRLNLAEGIQTIGKQAFSGCTRLEGALESGSLLDKDEYTYTGPNGATIILSDQNACLVIPESVMQIGEGAFEKCAAADLEEIGGKSYIIGIKNVNIKGNKDKGTTIGASAFAGCRNLTKLTLGEGVTGLGDSALDGTSLEEITIPSTFETGTAKNSPFTSGENSTLQKVTFANGIQVIPQYFLNNITTLTEIEVPKSVQKIGDHAFAGCSNLETVIFKDEADSKLSTIDTSAFEGCSLMTLSELPQSVTTINASAFKNCKFVRFTQLPEGLTTIGNSAFENCAGIQISKMPAITTLDDKAFAGCVSIQDLELDTSNLATINATVFEGCTDLSSVQIDGGEKKQTTIADGAFATCEKLSWVFINNIKSVGKKAFTNLPISILEINQVDAIGESAFAGCDKLENPVIQNTKTIGASAFAGAGYVEETGAEETDNEVRLYNIQNVGSRAFENSKFTAADICDLNAVTTYKDQETKVEYSPFAKSSIKSVRFNGAANNTVCANAFKNVTSLQSVELAEALGSENITIIAASAFEGCTALSVINLGEVKTINERAFYGCENLEKVELKQLVTLNGLAFYDCGIKEICIPISLKTVNTGTIENVSYGPFAGGKLESISFEELLTIVPDKLCLNTQSLKNIDFQSVNQSLDIIGKQAFEGCTSVETLDIPSISTVDEAAFKGCSALLSVKIAAKTVNTKAFANCEKLSDLQLEEGITTIQGMAFADTPLATVTIPNSLKTVGITSENQIEKGPFANTQIVSVHGKGEESAETGAIILPNTTELPDKLFAGCASITDVTIPATLQKIGTDTFKGCGVKNLQFEVQKAEDGTANGIQTIGQRAFANCDALEKVVLPETVTELKQEAFSNDDSLNEVDMSLVKELELSKWGTGVFKADTALEKVTLPKSAKITAVPESTFAECSALATCDIPGNITEIRTKAFEKAGLTKLYLPNQITKVGQSAFANCDKLTDLHISNNMSKIETGTFEGCTALQEVEIPVKIKEIGTKAFYGSGLKTVTILGDPVIGGGKNEKRAEINEQLSVFEKETPKDAQNNIYKHVFNTGFTLCAKEKTSLKTAYYDTYKSDKADAYKVLKSSDGATIAIYGGAYGNAEQPMQWEALDEAKHTATTVEITAEKSIVMIGGKQSLVAKVVKTETDPETGEEKTEEINAADLLVWESSNKDVATVDQNGIVTGRKEGKAVITATAGEAVGKYEIEVKSPIDKFEMKKKGETEAANDLSMEGGDKLYVTFTATKQNKEASDEYSVKAEDPSVISFTKQQDGTYEVKALKSGRTSIVCSANDGSSKSQSFKVNVNSTLYDVTDIKDFTSSNPEGTKTYAANSQDSWSYHVDGVSKMEVTFDDKTYVEDGKDYIYLYNKNGKKLLYDGDKLATGEAEKGYTGTQLAGKTVTVIGDTLRVQIVSNDSGQFYGFGVKSVVTVNKIKYVNGGTSDENPNPAEMRSDAEALVLQPAAKKSATFIGWYADKELTKEITQIEPCMGGVTIYAKWQPNPSVAYELDGGVNNAENPEYVAYDNKEAVKLGEPSRSGYTFLGWYTDQECTQIITEIKAGTKEDMTVYAKWKKNETVLPSEKPTQSPAPDPTKEPETPKPPVSDPTKDPTGTAQPTPSAVPSATPSAVPSETPVTVPVAGTALSAEKAGANYKVVSADEKKSTVAYTAPADKKVTKVTVPSTITVDGITYQVTEIGANAFKGCKKLKKVTIPANVTKIGKKAFYKCKALKTVTIKSKKLSSVGSAAFKGIAKKAVIKLPKAKKTAYKKLLKKKYDKTTKLK